MQDLTALSYRAMLFARDRHKLQRRKYTNNQYADHLAEVAGIALSVGWHSPSIHPDVMMAVCWLHDCMEDQGVSFDELHETFGVDVAIGVRTLSSLGKGSRRQRLLEYTAQLSGAQGWIQTIKCADIISNVSSIVEHDPKFAVTYLDEKREQLGVLKRADPHLLKLANNLVTSSHKVLLGSEL